MQFVASTPIEKGWSSDRKYRVTAEDGTPYLLRISPAEQYDRKIAEFAYMQKAADIGIPMCRPVALWQDERGVCSLQGWIEGEDAEAVIPTLPPDEQYVYGVEGGRLLRRLHTIPAPADAEPWSTRFGRKLDRKLMLYAACPLQYEQGEVFISYMAANRHRLTDRPQVAHHGDYHIGNLMLAAPDRTLTVIDFNRADHGDPWEEFNRIVWCAGVAPLFATGMVNGYFDARTAADIPTDFWALLALYIASNTLSSLPWAIPFGDEEIATMRRQAAEVLEWYEGMTRVVPTWYAGVLPLSDVTHP